MNPLSPSIQITTTLEQIGHFMSGTLLAVQESRLCTERSLAEIIRECVEVLKDKALITESPDPKDGTLHVTKLGRATFKGDSRILRTLSLDAHTKESVHMMDLISCTAKML